MKKWMKNLENKTICTLFFACAGLAALVLLTLFLNAQSGKKEPWKLIFVPKTIDPTNGFWTSLIDGAQLGAKEYGAQLEVMGETTEEDIEGQIQNIRICIEQKPDALLVAPCDYLRTADVLEEAADQGIRVILLDSVVERDVAECVVATDNFEAGRTLGRYAGELLKDEKNPKIGIVAHVQGTSTAMERERGIRDGLGSQANGILDVVFCDSSYDKAYVLTVSLLTRYPDTDLLIGTNEYAAVGAARALKDMKLAGKVRLIGFDSLIEEIQLLEEGVFQGIVIQKPFNIGYLGVGQAVRLLEGDKVEKNLSVGSRLITKENMYEEENQRLLYPFSGQQ